MNIASIKYNGKPVEVLYTKNPARLGFKTEVRNENGAVVTERVYLDRELRDYATAEHFVYLITQHFISKDYADEILQSIADDVQAVEDNYNAIVEE